MDVKTPSEMQCREKSDINESMITHKPCQEMAFTPFICCFLMLVLFSPAIGYEAHGQRYGAFGAGGMIGNPAGFSIKYWLSRRRAVAAGAAWTLENEPALHIHADYVLHRSDLEGLEDGRSYAYYGLGGRIKLENEDPRVGARIPLGATYLFPGGRFDAFFEVAPVFDVLPTTQLGLNLSLGGRFYFSSLGVR